MRFRPYSSPEFPNDNHQLHLGASWVCLSPTGAPRAVMRAARPLDQPTLVPLTPLPPSVAESVPAPSVAPSSKIPLPPASIVQSVMQRSPDGMGFTIRVPDPQLFNEWERPARTDELHLTEAPGPLLSQLLERFDSLQFQLTDEPSVDGELGTYDPAPETRRSVSPELEVPQVLEPEASVPPPVAELIESLPASTPMNESQLEADDRALSAELFEVLKTLEIIDSETEFSQVDAPPSGVQITPIISKSAVDDLADAVAEALCAEFGVGMDPDATSDTIESPSAVCIPEESICAHSDEAALPSESADGSAVELPNHYGDFVSALCGVALDSGATRAAAVLPRLLEGKLLDAGALADEVQSSLELAGIASLRGSCIEPSEDFKANASAWNRVLSGASDDLSACGDTLDGFAATLLGALLGPNSDPKQLRRELRKRGVAAFGMLSVAA
ncbi:MAG: hypothetical protein H6718_08235 [Polyangiaceae bacterium]|nr:hypothetical protein [Myxococcales bacterium]MCB9585372.1 hypothetical protein [Polyangiaceae bacterium]MCB9606613.1 hypothetical protein [Polyangiaceae bacterium]